MMAFGRFAISRYLCKNLEKRILLETIKLLPATEEVLKTSLVLQTCSNTVLRRISEMSYDIDIDSVMIELLFEHIKYTLI